VTPPGLVRGVGLRGATALNIISIVGIGPLITIPLVLGALHGPLSLVGWVCGAMLALCDGLVWAELGSLYPGSGGTYGYLRNVFGRTTWGRMLAFLFVWQTLLCAPLNQATGYIGFANYAGYLIPPLAANPWAIKALAIVVGIVTIAALYRGITGIAKIGIGFSIAAVLTLLGVIAGAYANFDPKLALAMPSSGSTHDSLLAGLGAGLGQGLLIAMYDYLGYNQSSCIGDEVRDPAKTIPRSIFLSILICAALYITMQLGVLGAIPWQKLVPLADGSLPPLGQHVASAVIERSFGPIVAGLVTVLILITAFASTYGNLLGYSRVPYAAAVDGVFLKPFAHVHGRLRFPDVSLVVMGLIALPACLFPLDAVIGALTTGIVLVQSCAQIVALVTLRVRGVRAPYRMLLFPIPAIVAFIGWAYIFEQAGLIPIVFGIASVSIGIAVYLIRAKRANDWPFAVPEPTRLSA
jgi:amino acid transporter